jgi:hypothetical protein
LLPSQSREQDAPTPEFDFHTGFRLPIKHRDRRRFPGQETWSFAALLGAEPAEMKSTTPVSKGLCPGNLGPNLAEIYLLARGDRP